MGCRDPQRRTHVRRDEPRLAVHGHAPDLSRILKPETSISPTIQTPIHQVTGHKKSYAAAYAHDAWTGQKRHFAGSGFGSNLPARTAASIW
ncbi:hypothetical protein GCM10012275_15310 [Longimycelium tulufanense]|uniref:Uncharacterized protein n=1 Tax=Longimycelium tulufanense TaxID=907463 RepID=A0A8J3CAP1_9PSEU|nr:hypothetical protein GCM10012275_15310 [Longimycelium tulufanense]